MANGNGNNINTDDAAAATTTTTTAQEQQHLTGDGSGACGDAKLPTIARGGNVNDLVADLWLNGSNNTSSSSRGDYTNIRATTTATPAAAAATAATSTTSATNSSTAASSSSTSTFSFKHFLNSSGTITAPSSTVTSLDAACSASSNSNSNSGPSCSSSSNTNATVTSASSLQTSTGARPKVPQSASVSHMQPDLNGSAASKMKRSPRFSSFDSQASLAEYAACASGGVGGGIISSSSSGSGTRLRPDLRIDVDRTGVGLDDDDDDYDHLGLAQVRNSRLYDDRVDDDIFPSAASNLQAGASSSRYVPRSYSSYDMPPHAAACAASSPRRRPALRPNRLVLTSVPKMKLDLPLEAASNVAGGSSALPDFVQDHLPDAWCQEAHLSSPPNSPLGAGADVPSCSGAAGGGSGVLLLPGTVAAGLSSVSTLPAASEPTAGSTVKMLPDFLSDGPILHSSQRLADVAIGLPSNPIDSPPQEADASTSTLRQENERLQRELQELRLELNVQRLRAHEFEQQLLSLTEARRRDSLAAAAQTQNGQRLRRQVAQLETELFALRGGSDQVPSGAAAAAAAAAGGVGGVGAGGASVMTPGSSHSSSSNTSRPSRTHHLSRDLLRAADNAEQNLRQLLAGVDNLRQMAASLEQPAAPAASPRSPNHDPYTDFN